MTTYNTGNPIGSTAVQDIYDNAENLDIAMHTPETTWVDRLGKTRRSWAGSTGYDLLGDYEAGITVTSFNQIILGPDGEFWRAAAGTTLPYVTTGAGLPEGGAFVSVGDAALRQQLADSDQGAAMVGFKQNGAAAVARTAENKLREIVSVTDFGAVGDGVANDTAAIQAAMDYLAERLDSSTGYDNPLGYGGTVFFPPGDYLVGNLIWRGYVSLAGYSAQSVFLVPAEGTTGFIFDLQNPTDRPKGIHVSEITISPSRNVSVPASSKPNVGGMNIEGFEKQCGLKRVHIYNIGGTALKTGDTQDMLIEDVEIRFVGKPLDINAKSVDGTGVINRTNAIKFVACRFENSGASTVTGQRSTHFIGCKFESVSMTVTAPHGLDFIGCDWALTEDFAIDVTGGTNRGLRILGGSTDTGLAIGTGSNSAKFIKSTVPVELIGMMLRGHASGAIEGNVSVVSSLFAECDRPYVASSYTTSYFADNTSENDTNGTGGLTPYQRGVGAPYTTPSGMFPSPMAAATWYQNKTQRDVILYIQLPYNTASAASYFEIKTRHSSGAEYTLGSVAHPNGGGTGSDVLSVILLPGESVWVNWTGGVSAATVRAFHR